MRIAVACDHGGYVLKDVVLEVIRKEGHEVLDFGTDGPASVDFSDFVEKAGRAMQDGRADRAVLICGSGVGVCLAANKMKGVYACVCHDTYSAHQGVEHDKMNALCLGGRVIGPEPAKEIVAAFLRARFCGEERFERRFKKVQKLEEE